jgi:hypothetical protein
VFPKTFGKSIETIYDAISERGESKKDSKKL